MMNAKLNSRAWIFPGQGSQSVGMGRDLFDSFAPARELLELASDLVGVNFAQIISRGPDALLTRTDNLQPAITVINLACCMVLQDAGFSSDVVAGHSLGEFSALFAAGVLSAHDVLRLVVVRAKLMQEVAATLSGGMAAVKDVAIDKIETIIQAAQAHGYVLGVANYNTTVQTVLTGHQSALEHIRPALLAAGGQFVLLNVSGPWHSSLLQPAAERFIEVLRTFEFQNANIPVVMNLNGEAETDAAKIKANMELQLCSPVQWVRIQNKLVEMNVSQVVEVGPGKVLRGLLRAVPGLSEAEVVNFEGPKSLRFLNRNEARITA